MADVRVRQPAHARSRRTTSARRSRRTWRVDARDTIEFPPSAAYGNVYMAQQKGLFFALNGKTGKPVFKTKNFKRCAAVLADAGERHDLPVLHGLRGVRAGRPEPDRLRDRHGRRDRQAEVALQGQAVRVLAAAARRDPLRGLVGRQRARDPGEDRQARVDLPDRQPGEHLGRVLEGADLHRQPGREPVRAQRQDRQARLEGRRRHGVLLRRARRGLRAGVHRQQRRHDVRLRRSAPASCCGPSRWAPTSTRRPRSTTRRSTPAATTASSTRSTPPRATCAGSARWRARCTRRRW